MEDHDAIADGEVFDAITDGCDGSGGLVAEDAWGGVRAAVDLLEIGAADAAGSDADENFTGSNGSGQALSRRERH